jgi:hypothetical protein
VALGTTTATTIGGYGCAVCALASCLTDAGVDIDGRAPDPGQLNRWLARNGGFYAGNLLVFDSVRPLGMQVVDYIDCRRFPAPVDRLAAALANDLSVVIQVDFRPGGGQNSHFVRLLRLERADALMMDPWLPSSWGVTWLMPRYARYSWDDPARAIMRAVIYGPVGASFAVELAERQDAPCPAPWVVDD